MSKPLNTVSRGAAESATAADHIGADPLPTLEAACSQYLELRSQVEGLELEQKRLAVKLGRLNLAIASHLGPLKYPLVLEVEGMLLVINVAEGLLKPGVTTATVAEALNARDVLDDALTSELKAIWNSESQYKPKANEALPTCQECGGQNLQPFQKGKDAVLRCQACLSFQEVA